MLHFMARLSDKALLARLVGHDSTSRNSNVPLADDRFTMAGGTRGTDLIVDEQCGADDRRIANATVSLPGEATRRTRPRQLAVRIECYHPNRVVVSPADRLALLQFSPFFPGCSRFVRQEVFLFETVLQRELESTLAGEHDVRRLLHDESSDRDQMFDVLQKRDRSAVRMRVHDACVQRHVSVTVGKSAVAN